uniref:Uncharacterized protein n=1 Tax=Anguilla anguilla TaxID=7936 RepID=A0A0E9P5W6_ANGAN
MENCTHQGEKGPFGYFNILYILPQRPPPFFVIKKCVEKYWK